MYLFDLKKMVPTVISASLLLLGSISNASLLCSPKTPSQDLKCLTLSIPNDAYASVGKQTFVNAGSSTIYSRGNQPMTVKITLEMTDGNIDRASSLNRGLKVDLSWANFVGHGSSGGDIDGVINAFDQRISFLGRMTCGSDLDNARRTACGLK